MKNINYGIDAPVVIRNLFIIGALLLLISLICFSFSSLPFLNIIASITIFPGICLIISGILMWLYGKFGKFKQRNRIINLYEWTGSEIVLDVGTGLGLLLIGAAKKLKTGKAFGIDIFNRYDLSGNTRKQLIQNLELEGVSAKAIIKEENILKTNFDDNFFDLIISNLCLHNLYRSAEREQACHEIFRILKPGGQIIISDFKHTKEYKRNFEKLDMRIIKQKTSFLDTFPPLTIIVAIKE